jgi:hypothetical protein
MTSITLASPVARREQVAAGLALPLGAMTCTGGIVFWEWSALTWIAAFAVCMGASYLFCGVRVLRGVADARHPLLLTAYAGIAFSVIKIAVWRETAAVPFGVAAVAIALLLGATTRGRRAAS